MVQVCVIGARGYLGSQISSSLEAKGFDVIRVNNTAQFLESPELIPSMRGDDGGTLVFAAGAVRHLTENPEIELYKANYSRALLDSFEIAKGLGLSRFLLLSSGDVYGFQHNKRVNEQSPVTPATPYGESRAEGETLAKSMAESEGLRLLVARLFLVSGPNQPGRFIDSALNALKAGLTFRVNNPTATRDFISVLDFLRFVEFAIRKENWKYLEVVNVCSGQGHFLRDVAIQVRDVVGMGEVAESLNSSGPGQNESLIGDPAKALEVFDWESSMSLTQIIEASYRG